LEDLLEVVGLELITESVRAGYTFADCRSCNTGRRPPSSSTIRSQYHAAAAAAAAARGVRLLARAQYCSKAATWPRHGVMEKHDVNHKKGGELSHATDNKQRKFGEHVVLETCIRRDTDRQTDRQTEKDSQGLQQCRSSCKMPTSAIVQRTDSVLV